MNNDSAGSGSLVCIPTYNEKENIEKIVPAVLDRLPKANVLVIDDNSPDGTGEIADAMAHADERIHVLHREGKEGLGKAYLAGFNWALRRNYKIIFEFDADFSHNPDYLPAFLKELRTADVVVGSRRIEGGGVENWGAGRRFLSWGGSFYARTILHVPVRDLTGGFNAFKREVLETIGLEDIQTSGYGFQIEIKYRAIMKGFKLVEFPIVFPDRVLGRSKMDRRIMMEAMWNVWKIRFDKSVRR